MRQTLNRCLLDLAQRQPDKVFWRQIHGDGLIELTFGALAERASAVAAALRHDGVLTGDVVLVFSPQRADAIVAFFGAMLAGAVPSFMPCPSAKQRAEVYWPAHRALLQRVGRHALIADAAMLEQMREQGLFDGTATGAPAFALDAMPADAGALALPDAAEQDIALLQHSSGTTALKKGVALSHRAIITHADAYAERLAMDGEDRIASWLPLYHDMGLIACTVTPLILGQTVTCLDPFDWVARPASLFDAIQRFGAHFAWLPNFAFEHLARTVPEDYQGNLTHIRAFIDCSEPCLAATFDRFARRFAGVGVRREHLHVCYAMAETVFAVSQTGCGEAARVLSVDAERLQHEQVAVEPAPGVRTMQLLSAGRPLPPLDVRIVRDGRQLPDGAVGEVTLRGNTLFDGYFRDPETTAQRLVDGAYHTRDRGFVYGGELYVLGRHDDMLIVNGRNSHAHEVESVVADVAGIRPGRAVAFGLPNAETGSEDLVVVAERESVADSGADAASARAIRRGVFDHTGIEVKTCRIVPPGWLLKTSSGKIGRGTNRDKYVAEFVAQHTASAGVAAGATLPKLAAFIAAFFKCRIAGIAAATVAADVEGWDSLAHSTLVMGVEKAFGVRFDDAEIFAFRTVGDLALRIDALLAAGPMTQATPDRVVHRSEAASIVRLGEGIGTAFDIVVFAGRSKSFGGLELMDFASVFAGTAAERSTKYFVTDHKQDWYVTCFDEVAGALNALSSRPKVLFGNSMGGYAALRFAAALNGVVSVLSIVPQSRPPVGVVNQSGQSPESLSVRLRPETYACVLFGEVEDEDDKAYLSGQMAGNDRHRRVIVRNCGHNLATYLSGKNLLRRVVECCVRPASMAAEIEAIVGGLQAEPDALRRRGEVLIRKQGRAVPADKKVNGKGDALPKKRSAKRIDANTEALARNFAKANVTADGRLTLEQASKRLPRVAQWFHMIDVQAKGYITVEDILTHRRRRVQQARRKSRPSATDTREPL